MSLTPSPEHPHLRTLLDLTGIPTAAGREHRIIAFIEAWAKARPELKCSRDRAGNLTIEFKRRVKPARGKALPPLFITAHLDHPAFVVERIVAPGTLEMSFRGGVNDVYFESAPLTLHLRDGRTATLTLAGKAPSSTQAGQHYLAELSDADESLEDAIAIGDIAVWRMLGPEIDSNGVLHTPCCDDLAAAAAALATMDELINRRKEGQIVQDVRLLFTRAEEIGFVGAIAAVKLKTMPKGSRVLALENSRAFADSPIGGGPIVRVGDRISVFTPWLTTACAVRAEQIFGGAHGAASSQSASASAPRKWQRKLMAGGACEASVFCAAGYDATCICLPLGNYHNMSNLDAVQAGTYDADKFGLPRCDREFIHTQDYLSMIDLLVALGQNLPMPGALDARFEKLYADKGHVLGAKKPPRPAKRAEVKANKPSENSRKSRKTKTRARTR